jgi:hypothetical protein
MDDFLPEPGNYHMNNGKEVLHQEHLSYSADKRLCCRTCYSSDAIVGRQTQFSEGMFTSYCHRLMFPDITVLDRLVDCADSWKAIKSLSRLSQKQYKAELRQPAYAVTNIILLALENKSTRYCFA